MTLPRPQFTVVVARQVAVFATDAAPYPFPSPQSNWRVNLEAARHAGQQTIMAQL
jgi:hypothetical protein